MILVCGSSRLLISLGNTVRGKKQNENMDWALGHTYFKWLKKEETVKGNRAKAACMWEENQESMISEDMWRNCGKEQEVINCVNCCWLKKKVWGLRITRWIRECRGNWWPCYWHLCAKSLQSSLTLCKPLDHNPPGSPVHGILQARKLECIVVPSSRGSSWPRDQTCISYVTCIGRRVL